MVKFDKGDYVEVTANYENLKGEIGTVMTSFEWQSEIWVVIKSAYMHDHAGSDFFLVVEEALSVAPY
jgi:hypothetical protein